ncbi:22029_t:CDS:2, partial [Gigaspora margarita]
YGLGAVVAGKGPVPVRTVWSEVVGIQKRSNGELSQQIVKGEYLNIYLKMKHLDVINAFLLGGIQGHPKVTTRVGAKILAEYPTTNIIKPKRRKKNFNTTTRTEALGLKKRKKIETDYLTKANKKIAKLQESKAETLVGEDENSLMESNMLVSNLQPGTSLGHPISVLIDEFNEKQADGIEE